MALTMPPEVSQIRGEGAPAMGSSGEAFYHEAAEAVQVDEGGELDAVTEGSAGGNDRVFESERCRC